MAKIQGELLRGNIDTIILKCLFEGDKYGNEICKAVEERTLGQFEIKQPTLYSCLTRLENQGLVTCTWVNTNNGGRRKYFTMTPAGFEFFTQKQKDWEFSRTVVDKLISEQIFDLGAELPVKAESEKTEPESEITATTVVPEKSEAEISATTVVPETTEAEINPQTVVAETDAQEDARAESEAAAVAAVAERPAAAYTEECAEPKELSDFVNSLTSTPSERATDAVRSHGGISYYDQLAEQTYTPPKRPMNNYFHFGEEEEEYEEAPEEEAFCAAEICARTEESARVESRSETVSGEILHRAEESARVDSRSETVSGEILHRTEESARVDSLSETVSGEILHRTEPPEAPLSPEEYQKRFDARNVLYAEAGDAFDNLKSVSAQQNETNRKPIPRITADESADFASDYKATLAALFPSAAPESEAAPESDARAIGAASGARPKERLSNGLTVRRHSRELTRDYNQKYYVFGNRLRLYQNLILAAVILVEILICYFGLFVSADIRGDFWLYFVSAALAVVFPLAAAAVYFVNPYKIERSDAERKNHLTYRFILALQVMVLIFCIEILVDKNVLTDLGYLNRVILPAVLCVDIAIHALIGQALVRSKRFAVN